MTIITTNISSAGPAGGATDGAGPAGGATGGAGTVCVTARVRVVELPALSTTMIVKLLVPPERVTALLKEPPTTGTDCPFT